MLVHVLIISSLNKSQLKLQNTATHLYMHQPNLENNGKFVNGNYPDSSTNFEENNI